MIDWTLNAGNIFTVIGSGAAVSMVFLKLRDALRDNTSAIKSITKIIETHETKIEEHEKQINIWKGAGVGGQS